MHTSGDFTGCEETREACLTIGFDFEAAVLVVEGGEDEHRLFTDVDIMAVEDFEFPHEFALNGTFPHNRIDHRGIDPDSSTQSSRHDVSLAWTRDRRDRG